MNKNILKNRKAILSAALVIAATASAFAQGNGIAGINALRPDWLGLAASGLGVLFIRGEKKGAKKAKKLARALLYGSAHALITRWVATSEIPIPFVNGGMPTPAQQRA